jgi:FkbM family methyltransferase
MKALFYRDFRKDFIPDVIKETWIEHIYDPYRKKNAVVMEVGANVGIFTLYAYEFASKIYAVEPSTLHYETLTTMLTYNEMLDKVIPIQCAVGAVNGTMTLYNNPNNSTMVSLNPIVKDENNSESVGVKTLKTLMTEYKIKHIDLLNLDVEGAEMGIFASSEFSEVAPHIDTVVVEYHSWTNISPNILVASLRDRGYKISQANTRATVFIGTRV